MIFIVIVNICYYIWYRHVIMEKARHNVLVKTTFFSFFLIIFTFLSLSKHRSTQLKTFFFILVDYINWSRYELGRQYLIAPTGTARWWFAIELLSPNKTALAIVCREEYGEVLSSIPLNYIHSSWIITWKKQLQLINPLHLYP